MNAKQVTEERHIDLAAHARSPAQARTFVRETLKDWGYMEVEPEVSLAVTELVTNALVHADSPSSLSLSDLEGSVRIVVHDNEPQLPHVVHAEDGDTHGRGLAMIDALATCWGVEMDERGKIVWLDISDGPGKH